MNKFILYVSLLFIVTLPALAADNDDGVNAAADAAIRTRLIDKLPYLKVDSIVPSVVSGMYEVTVDGNVLYVSGDGRYFFIGDLRDMETGVNLTDEKRAQARLKLLSAIDHKDMIHFDAAKSKYSVTVFTDIDCGYCRKLHSEIAGYNDLGIDIQYLFYPRSGIGGDSYKKAVSVWCAKDPKQAMTEAKLGKSLPKADCENPVADQYKLGEKFGIRGTPALVFENGLMLPGYLPPDKMLQALKEELGVR